MTGKKYESLLKIYYMTYIRGERQITDKVINKFKNDLLKLEKYETTNKPTRI